MGEESSPMRVGSRGGRSLPLVGGPGGESLPGLGVGAKRPAGFVGQSPAPLGRAHNPARVIVGYIHRIPPTRLQR